MGHEMTPNPNNALPSSGITEQKTVQTKFTNKLHIPPNHFRYERMVHPITLDLGAAKKRWVR